MDLLLCILLHFLCVFQGSHGMEGKHTISRQMGKASYHIVSATRSIYTMTQKYVTVVRAPINTEMEIHQDRAKMGTAEWTLVSLESDGTSSLYNATVSAPRYADLILPIKLISNKENLELYLNPLVEREKQTEFKFKNCQFQVEQQNSLVSALYKITIKSCHCEYGFQASVGKITPFGFVETGTLSPLYFSRVDMSDESMRDGQISAISINRTALTKDGVQVQSLKFAIRSLGNFRTDVISEYTYSYNLI